MATSVSTATHAHNQKAADSCTTSINKLERDLSSARLTSDMGKIKSKSRRKEGLLHRRVQRNLEGIQESLAQKQSYGCEWRASDRFIDNSRTKDEVWPEKDE